MIKIVLKLYFQGYTKHSQGAELRATENSVEVLNLGPPDSKSSFWVEITLSKIWWNKYLFGFNLRKQPSFFSSI